MIKKFFVSLITVLFLFHCVPQDNDKDDFSFLPFLLTNKVKNQNHLLAFLILKDKDKVDKYHDKDHDDHDREHDDDDRDHDDDDRDHDDDREQDDHDKEHDDDHKEYDDD